MILKLNERDRKKFNILENALALNETAVKVYSNYLNFTPTFITRELICEIADTEDKTSEEYAVSALLCAAVGIDPERGKLEKSFFRNYVIPSISKLDPEKYRSDPYYKNIKFPAVCHKNWEFKHECFAPYELFVQNDPCMLDSYREIPCIGFFSEEFSFPAVLQNGREWMTVTPNEINTMKEPIKKARGNIVTFGLGLGYFAYMACQKDTVKSVTVIEKDENVIHLFEKYILPQFAHGDKLKIVCEDAFEYAKKIMPHSDFDFAFVDLWHDASDGLSMYAEMRRLEALSSKTEFSYWIENTLISHLRRMVASELASGDGKTLTSYEEIEEILSDDYLKSIVKNIKKEDQP